MSSRIWKSIVGNRIIWAIVSVVTAFLIWQYVVTQINPVRQIRILFNIEYQGAEQLFERYGLRLSSDAPRQIRMKVSGTYGDVSRIQDSAVLVVDISNVQAPGEQQLKFAPLLPSGISGTPDIITVNNENYLTLSFDVIKSKTVDILNNGAIKGIEVGEGYIYDPEKVSHTPDKVTITGPADIVDSIDHAQVCSLEMTEKLTKTTQLERPIEFVLTSKTEGAEPQILSVADRRELEVDTETVTVTIPIERLKEVKLTADIKYGGGATEDNTTVEYSPVTVYISGDPEILSTIDEINLGTIDLATYDATQFNKKFEISYQEGVNGDIMEATVTVEISNVVSDDFTISNIFVINVPEGYSYEILTNELTVTLRGRFDLINGLEANGVRALVDLSGITAEGSVNMMAAVSVDGIENGEVGAIVRDTNKVTIVLTKE